MQNNTAQYTPTPLLVTGCYRSGTTLVDKLLNTHPDLVVASQAYPALFTYAKQRFLDARGLTRRYPLDHLFRERDYTPEEFAAFLDHTVFDTEDLDTIFDQLRALVDPAWTPEILDYRSHIHPAEFLKLLEQFNQCILDIFSGSKPRYVGDKEIMVEEYLPYLVDRGAFAVITIRDPRDVVASAHFSQQSFIGAQRPVLYTIRAWRRGVAFALALQDHPRCASLRYEDLVSAPVPALSRLAERLEIPPFCEEWYADGLRDQHGHPWESNSSFARAGGIDTGGAGRYRSQLPETVLRYVETLCYPEMCALGYQPDLVSECSFEILRDYRDPFAVTHGRFTDCPGYSSDPERLRHEAERLMLLQSGGELTDAEAGRWFVHPGAYVPLKNASARGFDSVLKES